MVDDSIVRGTTFKENCKPFYVTSVQQKFTFVHLLRRLCSLCYFGTDVPSKDQLVACNYTMDGIKELIGADSIGFFER